MILARFLVLAALFQPAFVNSQPLRFRGSSPGGCNGSEDSRSRRRTPTRRWRRLDFLRTLFATTTDGEGKFLLSESASRAVSR
jgi:hypothetical protein